MRWILSYHIIPISDGMYQLFFKKLSNSLQYGLGGAYRWQVEYGIPPSSWATTAARRCRDTTLTRI